MAVMPEATAEAVHARLLQAQLLCSSPDYLAEQRERSIRANEEFRVQQEEKRRGRYAKAYLDRKIRERKRRRDRNRRIAWTLFLTAVLVYSALGLSSTDFFAVVR